MADTGNKIITLQNLDYYDKNSIRSTQQHLLTLASTVSDMADKVNALENGNSGAEMSGSVSYDKTTLMGIKNILKDRLEDRFLNIGDAVNIHLKDGSELEMVVFNIGGIRNSVFYEEEKYGASVIKPHIITLISKHLFADTEWPCAKSYSTLQTKFFSSALHDQFISLSNSINDSDAALLSPIPFYTLYRTYSSKAGYSVTGTAGFRVFPFHMGMLNNLVKYNYSSEPSFFNTQKTMLEDIIAETENKSIWTPDWAVVYEKSTNNTPAVDSRRVENANNLTEHVVTADLLHTNRDYHQIGYQSTTKKAGIIACCCISDGDIPIDSNFFLIEKPSGQIQFVDKN